jgi:lipopolysaccharide/colanic/teichoic acid biosynthesis glycosyltransferase
MTSPSTLRRALDVACGLLALVVLSPLLAVLTVLVRATSPGPALFRQQRVGEGGTAFTLYKFRSMQWKSDGPEVTAGADPRVTPLGEWMRRTKLDELPQLLNLVRGDMTLVGPRPETVGLAQRYPSDCRWVLNHRPGITGPVQLSSQELAAPPDGVHDPEGYYLAVLVPRRTALDADFLAAPTLARELDLVLRTVRRMAAPERTAQPSSQPST